jgi:hypothetical protein
MLRPNGRLPSADSFASACCGLLIATGWFTSGCGGQSVSRPGDDHEVMAGAGGSARDPSADGGSSSGGKPEGCQSTEVAVPATSVTLAFRNDTTKAIHIPRHECSAFFRIESVDPDGSGTFPRRLTADGDPMGRGPLLPLCSKLPEACSSGGQQNACTFDLLELAPGEEVKFEWSGALYSVLAIAPECRDSDCEMAQCSGEQAARPGRYRIEVQALSWLPQCESDSCSCQWVSGGACCEADAACPCQPYDDGTCRHRSHSPDLGFLDVSDLDVNVEFAYPTTDAVLVVFE